MIRLADAKSPDTIRPMGASRSASAGWGSLAILFICLCFCSICGWIIFDARKEAWKHANVVGSTVVASIAADLARNIETLDLSIIGAMENLDLPGLERMSPQERQLLLFDRSVAARHLSAVLVMTEDGRIAYDSRTTSPAPVDFSDRDHFKIHKYND